jgi:hypothetical protein
MNITPKKVKLIHYMKKVSLNNKIKKNINPDFDSSGFLLYICISIGLVIQRIE